jgi:hypothetical protein
MLNKRRYRPFIQDLGALPVGEEITQRKKIGVGEDMQYLLQHPFRAAECHQPVVNDSDSQSTQVDAVRKTVPVPSAVPAVDELQL